MAITTIRGHVNRALRFFNGDVPYFCIGQSTAWPDDNNPPSPDPNVVDVSGIIGFRRIDTMNMVIPDASGTIQYQNQNWLIVDPTQALAQGARWVYLETTIYDTDLPLGYYRQVGTYTGLQMAPGVPSGQYALTPSQVSSNGILGMLDNRKPSNRQTGQKEKLTVIIEF